MVNQLRTTKKNWTGAFSINKL